ncbi:MAG: aldehyde-activating protein [Gammaproteobacteria bacterium SG8_31]|jgi:hypothetical protein|nr:MAG: aldehyde-activating protein [Gammaproteobacteria bacterium SG8_31]
MSTRQASCSCGQLSVTTHGDPVRVSICHCLACQKRTGSTYGAQARFPADKVEVCGNSTEYVRTADSGRTIRFNFCPACGSTVFYQIDDAPDVIAVPIGGFADPDFPPPRVSVYESRRHEWVHVPQELEHYD